MAGVKWAGLALLVIWSASCKVAQDELPPVHAAEPIDVSLVQLVANPSEYQGKQVRVIGFCHLEFEGNGLYIHREDLEHAISKNAVWLDVGPSSAQRLLSDQYVLVEGTFDAQRKGHMSMFSGYLTEISRMERWPTRAEFEKPRR